MGLNYENAKAEVAVCGRENYIPPTVREKLVKQRDQLQRRMDEINTALNLMDANPTFEKVHDAIAKVGCL